LSICISDNGKGFDTSKKYDGHYGLKNMMERAKEIDATVCFTSSQDSGTEIEISLPFRGMLDS
jgi:signal transduction histidine kinase